MGRLRHHTPLTPAHRQNEAVVEAEKAVGAADGVGRGCGMPRRQRLFLGRRPVGAGKPADRRGGDAERPPVKVKAVRQPVLPDPAGGRAGRQPVGGAAEEKPVKPNAITVTAVVI